MVAEGPVCPASKTVLGGLGQWINRPLRVPPWPGPEAALAAVPGILSPVQAGCVLGSGPWEWDAEKKNGTGNGTKDVEM